MIKSSYQEVILRQDVKKLGNRGDVVRVKPGYARNYLIPEGLAVEATPGNLQLLEVEKKRATVQKRKAGEKAKEVAKKLKEVSLTASVQVGEEDRIFGSVTAKTISNLLKEQGYDIDKKNVLLTESIKTLGRYSVPVEVDGDVQVEVKVYVIKE